MNGNTKLLIIDDDKALLMGLESLLRREGIYQVITANNGELGIQIAKEQLPDLIICDMMMPPPDGLAILQTLAQRVDTASIPFIFLTARTGEKDKIHGFNMGADEYITKPFSKHELFARIHAILRRKEKAEAIERYKSEETIRTLRSQIGELLRTSSYNHTGLAEAMAHMLSIRDSETEEHGRRVVEMSDLITQELQLGSELRQQIHIGALLHDIGKVGIPDAILLKTGALSPEERSIMIHHAALGRNILQPLGLPNIAIELVYHHHERWDGGGYPDGLKGEDIPLSARIFAIIDVWDALVNERPYHHAWDREQAITHIREQSGKHFDPFIAAKFIEIIEQERQGG